MSALAPTPLPPGAGPGSGTEPPPRPRPDFDSEPAPEAGKEAGPGPSGPGSGADSWSQARRPDWLRVQHAAIIMDGNGRWAQQQDLPRLEGHRRGARSVREVVRAAREIGLAALTLYAFSEQNWERPLEEVQGLMHLLHDYLIDERSEILDNGIRLRAIGNIVRLPDFVQRPLQQLIAESAHNRDMTLSLALSYDGRESILEAVRGVAEKVRAGLLRPEQIDEAALTSCFQTAELPPVDLIIRTSGELRTSNFLLWESTHAEFYTTPALWPEFTRAELHAALRSVSTGRATASAAAPGVPADAAPAAGEPGSLL